MPRSSAQSDFVFQAEVPDQVFEGPIGEATGAVELPHAVARSSMASARATRWILIFTAIMLGALVLLTVIGPHVPSGE